MNAAWVTALSALAVAVGALVTFCARWAWRVSSRIMRFLDDYLGEPARDGVPARLGVMARLAEMEHALAEVRAETKPNGGHSMRDAVHRAADAAADVKGQVSRLARRVEQIEHAREKRESTDG